MGQSPSFSSVHQGSEATPRPVTMVISLLLFGTCDLQYFYMVSLNKAALIFLYIILCTGF
jgi:hypothetical protein